MRVVVINGPNLDLLGTREPETYGSMTLPELQDEITSWGRSLGIETTMFQSNDEGAMVDAIHEAAGAEGILLNPGAFTHTSRAIADAVAAIPAPVVEVHISDIMSREPWRGDSVLEDVVIRTIFGRGIAGYRDGLRLLVALQTPARLIRYGPHQENVADLRAAQDPAALVVLIHGGFWLRTYGRDTVDSLAVDLFRRGYATANVEYRRMGIGGAWPGSGHDIKMAADFLTTQPHLRGLPVAILGHSAGGYLALWASSRLAPALTVGLAAITDLKRFDLGPGRQPAHEMLSHGAPSTVEGSGNIALFHGAEDRLVAPEQSTSHTTAQVKVITGMGHFELLDPAAAHWETVLERIDAVIG